MRLKQPEFFGYELKYDPYLYGKKNMKQFHTYEFFGLPASGKTTIKNDIKNRCSELGIQLLTRDDFIQWKSGKSVLSSLKLIAIYPLVFSRLMALVILYYLSLGNKSGDALYRSIVFPVVVLMKYEFCRQNRGVAVVYDLGPLQGIWSVSLDCEKYNKNILKRLILEVSDFTGFRYVYVEGDVSLSLDRIRHRKNSKSRIDAMPFDKQMKSLQSGSFVMDFLVNTIKETKGLIILKKTNKADVNSRLFVDHYLIMSK
jgi:hypothetical protein